MMNMAAKLVYGNEKFDALPQHVQRIINNETELQLMILPER